MPGLMRGVARTAVVAGTATAVSNRVSRRQANRWSSTRGAAVRGAAAARTGAGTGRPPAPEAPDTVTQLKQLAELKDQGILTEAEFDAQKAKMLAAM